jgi:hypothetical protein
VSLLAHAGILTSAKDYYNSVQCSSRRADWGLECSKKQYTQVEYVAVKQQSDLLIIAS